MKSQDGPRGRPPCDEAMECPRVCQGRSFASAVNMRRFNNEYFFTLISLISFVYLLVCRTVYQRYNNNSGLLVK